MIRLTWWSNQCYCCYWVIVVFIITKQQIILNVTDTPSSYTTLHGYDGDHSIIIISIINHYHISNIIIITSLPYNTIIVNTISTIISSSTTSSSSSSSWGLSYRRVDVGDFRITGNCVEHFLPQKNILNLFPIRRSVSQVRHIITGEFRRRRIKYLCTQYNLHHGLLRKLMSTRSIYLSYIIGYLALCMSGMGSPFCLDCTAKASICSINILRCYCNTWIDQFHHHHHHP